MQTPLSFKRWCRALLPDVVNVSEAGEQGSCAETSGRVLAAGRDAGAQLA